MPLEYYLGITVALVIVALLVSLTRGKRAARRVMDKSSDSYQLTHQLSRIADALEALVLHLRAASPEVIQPSEPVKEFSERKAPEPNRTDEAKSGEPTKQHVVLSMFGR